MAEPCSRCGVEAIVATSNTGPDKSWVWFYECLSCGRLGPSAATALGARIKWDDRQTLIAAAYQSNPPQMPPDPFLNHRFEGRVGIQEYTFEDIDWGSRGAPADHD